MKNRFLNTKNFANAIIISLYFFTDAWGQSVPVNTPIIIAPIFTICSPPNIKWDGVITGPNRKGNNLRETSESGYINSISLLCASKLFSTSPIYQNDHNVDSRDIITNAYVNNSDYSNYRLEVRSGLGSVGLFIDYNNDKRPDQFYPVGLMTDGSYTRSFNLDKTKLNSNTVRIFVLCTDKPNMDINSFCNQKYDNGELESYVFNVCGSAQLSAGLNDTLCAGSTISLGNNFLGSLNRKYLWRSSYHVITSPSSFLRQDVRVMRTDNFTLSYMENLTKCEYRSTKMVLVNIVPPKPTLSIAGESTLISSICPGDQKALVISIPTSPNTPTTNLNTLSIQWKRMEGPFVSGNTSSAPSQTVGLPGNYLAYVSYPKIAACGGPSSSTNSVEIKLKAAPIKPGSIAYSATTAPSGGASGLISNLENPSGGAPVVKYVWQRNEGFNCSGYWIAQPKDTLLYLEVEKLIKSTCFRRAAISACETVYSNIVTINVSGDTTNNPRKPTADISGGGILGSDIVITVFPNGSIPPWTVFVEIVYDSSGFSRNLDEEYVINTIPYTYRSKRAGTYRIKSVERNTVGNGEAIVYITDRDSSEVFVWNAISPNGDGKNDLFEIEIPKRLMNKNAQIVIFDREGTKLADNEILIGNALPLNAAEDMYLYHWDCKNPAGELLNPGTYFFSFKVQDFEKDKRASKSGFIEVRR